MYISHYDVRLFYKCPTLLYLNLHGPQDEKQIHPIIQRRKQYTRNSFLESINVEQETQRTISQMEKARKSIYQCFISTNNLVAKVDRLDKVDNESNLGSYSYAASFTRNTLTPKKPLLMEGVYVSYILQKILNTEINEFYVQKQNDIEPISITEYLSDFEKDLVLIDEIIRGEKEISPNYVRTCRVCEWRYYCKKTAAESSDLTLISGIGGKIKKKLIALGIEDVPSLAQVDLNSLPKDLTSNADFDFFVKQAKSITQKEAIVRESIKLPETPIELHVDIEGSSHHNFVWIIGCLMRKEGEVEYISFLANTPKEEKEMVVSFLDFISNLGDDFTLYHWSSAEPQYFKNLFTKYSLPLDILNKLNHNSFDLFPIFKRKIILPLFTYTLKDVANFLGFQWHDPLTDGATSIVLFDKWYFEKDKKSLQKAISYNSDDCKALLIIKDYLSKKLSAK